ncbi:hypothetical protein ASZ90_018886 [hydrocarbon metagenome]|uniref:ResB-like domain-containing protein n=1 Tax=hydrocarbon metagenome TaxID=938273 RepID=A0A0W8E547_9ZZZZ
MHEYLYVIYKNVSSMKTGLVLLAILAVFSAVGSSIFPDTFHRMMIFNFILIMLLINLGFCTINRCLKVRKVLWTKQPNVMNQIRQWGLLALHTGLILILAGGIINTSAGQSGTVKLAEGERSVIARDKEGENISLHLEEFDIELYENNMPSQYLSKVLLYKGDSLVSQSIISVNHPLRFEGLKVYQQSYGNMVEVAIEGEGKVDNLSAVEGQMLEMPGGSWQVKVFKYVPDFDPDYGMESKTIQPNNPRIIYSVYQDNVLMGVGAAPFGERIQIDSASYVQFNKLKSYSVLKVKEDPGLPYAGAGGILFMLGVALAEINVLGRPSRKNDRKVMEE